MRWLRRRQPAPVWCDGCGKERAVCAMNWNTLGQYRCRQCNPDPGPPHDSQSPAQRARSERYARAKANQHKHRCTEHGGRFRVGDNVWDFMGWAPSRRAQHEAEAAQLGPVLRYAQLCDACVGDNPFDRGFIAMEVARIW